MATLVTGAFGCIGAWVRRRLLEVGEKPVAVDLGDDPWRMRTILGPERLRHVGMVIEEAWPSAQGTITHVEQGLPFPSALADRRYERDLGSAPRTGLRDGIRKTLDEFAALQLAGRLDARELAAAT